MDVRHSEVVDLANRLWPAEGTMTINYDVNTDTWLIVSDGDMHDLDREGRVVCHTQCQEREQSLARAVFG